MEQDFQELLENTLGGIKVYCTNKCRKATTQNIGAIMKEMNVLYELSMQIKEMMPKNNVSKPIVAPEAPVSAAPMVDTKKVCIAEPSLVAQMGDTIKSGKEVFKRKSTPSLQEMESYLLAVGAKDNEAVFLANQIVDREYKTGSGEIIEALDKYLLKMLNSNRERRKKK